MENMGDKTLIIKNAGAGKTRRQQVKTIMDTIENKKFFGSIELIYRGGKIGRVKVTQSVEVR